LRNNAELSPRNFEALKSLKVNSKIIPKSKFMEYTLVLNREINRWLTEYLDSFLSYPLKIQPASFKARLDVYLFSIGIDGFEKRIDKTIQEKTIGLSHSLHKIGYSIELDTGKSNEYWKNFTSRSKNKIPADIESLSKSTLNNVAKSRELSRIYNAATSDWIELLSKFEYDKSLVHNQKIIAIIASKANLIKSLRN
jgi:hypothetical protein